PAARPRLGPVHARRDAGARGGHARHQERRAEDRGPRGRVVSLLHAPLQLSLVLGGGGAALRLPGTAGDRPRRARRAGDAAGRAAEGAVPVHDLIVSDILESNGSSSMATVCGASLALMDAG